MLVYDGSVVSVVLFSSVCRNCVWFIVVCCFVIFGDDRVVLDCVG